MIISSAQIQRTLALYAQCQNHFSGTRKANTHQEDQVSLSSSYLEAQEVIKQLHEQPAVRSLLVNQLREEIRQGQYNLKGEEVAAKLLGRLTVDRLI
jgi:flagellar biosynthesis anti-sigma factor FlgM